ncbi:hypothetical protein N836_21795 [Leptolyngbya sp. Heron Island J]|uniref:hypothetical protein n=1 Tax=Leptolyngbya sp. Heron Island J TaxID=1385935 RepID=UPI0003B98B05|nr:hypothetical protein [Leptolyngbya sp. Heron Island J]ESA33322.1 hypothetical protein N836_21795 [Leptolyngbya sp. Heron Island J]
MGGSLLLVGLGVGAVLTPTETAVLWGLHHPYWLVAIAITLIILLQLSISLTGQLLHRLLKWLGRSPFSLGRWLLTKTTTPETSQEQQIATILQRLNSLQEEQAILLAELKKQLPNKE